MKIDLRKKTKLLFDKSWFNNDKQERDARIELNKINFIAEASIPIIDYLAETTLFKQGLKRGLKMVISECEKLNKVHFKSYDEFGKVTQPDGTEIDAKDIYQITSKAYDFILSKQPHEIAVIAEMVSKMDEQGLDYQEVDIAFTPMKD